MYILQSGEYKVHTPVWLPRSFGTESIRSCGSLPEGTKLMMTACLLVISTATVQYAGSTGNGTGTHLVVCAGLEEVCTKTTWIPSSLLLRKNAVLWSKRPKDSGSKKDPKTLV
jgi:hypothetical protein